MEQDHTAPGRRGILLGWTAILVAVALTLPGLFLRISGVAIPPDLEALTFGLTIVAAAFLLTWSAEVAEMDLARSLVLAFVALVTVLPEYSVDLYFAWRAGIGGPASPYIHYAAANMTGANRLLVGLGWPLVGLLFLARRRGFLVLRHGLDLELLFMFLATLYAFLLIVPKGNIAVWDGVVLVAAFLLYMALSARGEQVEPELMGPPASIGALPPVGRRVVVVALFIFSALAILASAEPFAEGLLGVGEQFNINKFVLVQWVAPLASESSEILVAALMTLRGRAASAMTALISAKVNQWTLLVGTLPLVYGATSLGARGVFPLDMPLDPRQVEEVFLTAAQSLFAVVLLLRLRVGPVAMVVLFALWAGQLAFFTTFVRYLFSGFYLGLTVLLLALDRGRLKELGLLFPRVWAMARQ